MPKSASDEQVLADEAVPSSTKYKNKWALKLFREWQQQREMKVPILDPDGLFKDYELHKVNPVSCEIEDMDAISLNYWLTKFVMEVAKDSGERYPPRTVYGIVCGAKRHLGDKREFKIYDATVAKTSLKIASSSFSIYFAIISVCLTFESARNYPGTEFRGAVSTLGKNIQICA